MGLFLFFTTLFGIAALLSSVLAYNFGFYSLGDWSIWMGWGGLTFFIFAVIGIGFKKALENIVFVVFKKFFNVVKHSGTVNEEKVDGERRRFLQCSMNIGIIAASGSLTFSGMILIGGVADYSAPYRSSHDSSPAHAMGEASNADVKILLAHQPQSVYEAAQAGFDLQLSGHTHGGMFPLFRWLRSWSQPFQAGLYKYKNTQLYVNSGTGYWGIPWRYETPPEITHLKLTVQKNKVGA